LCPLWLRAPILVCRCVSHRPTISHGFLARAALTDAQQARAGEPIDAPAAVALPADAQGQAAECTYYVPSAVAEPA
jgi:hypothetical protein